VIFTGGTLLLGVVVFVIWSWHTRRWPFALAAAA
jgi:hypothetical protein